MVSALVALIISLLIALCIVVYVRSTTTIRPRDVDYLSADEEKKRLQAKRDRRSIRRWQQFTKR
jgi:hypothetical protein